MITLSKAKEISIQKIGTLSPLFIESAKSWYEEMCKQQFNILIYEGIRSIQRQDELYTQGRSKSGRIVTNAKGGQSFHNYGFAFDYVPLIKNDKVEDMYESDWDDTLVYNKGKFLAAQFDLRWLSWETPHLESTKFKNWEELSLKFKPFSELV